MNLSISQVDNASLVFFRFCFGMVAMWSALRFLLNGWVEQFFAEPTFFFPFSGFEFVSVLPLKWMYVAFIVLSVLGLMIALGFLYRLATIGYFLIFTYVELIDVTNYLNHYYLVSLLTFIIIFLPLNRRASIDLLIWPRLYRDRIGVHALYWLRAQVAIVYFFAGIAKATSDWLVHAHPLTIWLRSRVETPIVGELFQYRESAYFMSWAGFLFDSTIVIWLLWPKTRKLAYLALVAFHVSTGFLFNIGMFPWIMIVAATVFFSPQWPSSLLSQVESKFNRLSSKIVSVEPIKVSAYFLTFIVLWCIFQALFPLRTYLYGGNVLWHEQGMRWSWRVMVREKNGSISYRVVDAKGRTQLVSPRRYLTAHQAREMSGQPDLIAKLGQRIGRDSGQGAKVFVDALVSLNGRKPVYLIDPKQDLMNVKLGISFYDWIADEPKSLLP